MPPPKDPKKYELYIKRQSESHKGHKDSLKTRRKKSESHKGRTYEEIMGVEKAKETKRKIGEANKRRFREKG